MPTDAPRDLPEPSDREPEPEFHSMSLAMEWVSRIMAACVAMVGPILIGVWLDDRFGTKWIMPVAVLVGLFLGMGYLIAISARPRTKKQS